MEFIIISDWKGLTEMLRKLILPALSLVVVILVAQIPMFPLLVEVRSISEGGESLSQSLQFVSMGEFYEAARFARYAWLDSTRYLYIVLYIFNHGILLALFWVCIKVLKRAWK